MLVYQVKYAAALALVQLKVAGCSCIVVAKHRGLGCLVRVDGPPNQFLRGAAIGVSCSKGTQSAVREGCWFRPIAEVADRVAMPRL